MNHSKKNRTFSRERNQRNALIKTLAVSLIKKGKIETTEPKAKSLRTVVEKMITRGKDGTLQATRLLAAKVGPTCAEKIVKEYSPKFKDRNGGYLRIIKTRTRLSDGAKMAQIEFV